MRPTRQRSWFTRFTKTTAHATGRPLAFLFAVAIVAVWAITGPLFGFSDTWQLVINTGTTIVTFLMVFLIQNTQNRDAEAMQLKLDELIRAIATRTQRAARSRGAGGTGFRSDTGVLPSHRPRGASHASRERALARADVVPREEDGRSK